MRAAWYEKSGSAADVMKVGDLPDPEPAAGEVRVRLHASAVNPSDVKARGGSRAIRWPKLIPNSDGAGVIDAVGTGVNRRPGERAWVFNGKCKAEVGGVDRIVEVDFGKNLPVSAQVINDGGVIACYASTSIPRPVYPYPEMLWRNPVVRQVFVYTMSDAAKAQVHTDIARWVEESKPVFAIAQRFALAEVVQAHEAVERGEKIGHVVLELP